MLKLDAKLASEKNPYYISYNLILHFVDLHIFQITQTYHFNCHMLIYKKIINRNIAPVPYMNTLRKMHFFHPRIYVI